MKLRSLILFACLSPVVSLAQLNLQKKGSLTVVMEPDVEWLLETYKGMNSSKKELTGYRVQIFNGKRQQMMKLRSEFVDVFPNVPVYNLYESPEYKLQVGDFRTRLEAENFLRQVNAEFGSGFVVKTMIKFPKLYYPIKE